MHVAATVTTLEVRNVLLFTMSRSERIRGSFQVYSLPCAPCAARVTAFGSLVIVAVIAAACSGSSTRAEPLDPPGRSPRNRAYRLDSTLTLNEIQVLGSHNSYHGAPYPQILAELRKATRRRARRQPRLRHRPLPEQFDLGRAADRARRVRRPSGRQVRACAGARGPRDPRARSGGHAQARIQGAARSVHRHALDVPHVRAVPPAVKTWSDAHPGTCR
jgi:hypothetical protein